MPNYDFKLDLSLSRKSQKEIARLLEKTYNAKILEDDNDTSEYDILAIIKEKRYSFEIKDDYMAEKTGNIAIEYFSRGKPSGISTTQADFYIYIINTVKKENYCYMIKVSKLKELIKDNLFFRSVDGGDKGSHTLCYLFKENIFSKYSRRLYVK